MSGTVGVALLAGAIGTLSALLIGSLRRRPASGAGALAHRVLAVLPGANCEACGNPSCFIAAEGIASGRSPVDTCVTGGEGTAAAVAAVLAASVSPDPPSRAGADRGTGGVGDGSATHVEAGRGA